MRYLIKIAVIMAVLMVHSCDSVTNISDSTSITDDSWLIPESEVVDGGPGKDGIPSIDDPKFMDAENIDYVAEDRLVTGIRINNTIKAYPHQVMDHHEIVNDRIDDFPICLSYCPLTGTAIAWDRTIDGEAVEFGVSGLLFRNNLIPYDRKTDTNYSQMQMRGVSGTRAESLLETRQVIQTTWKTWKNMYPDSKILTTETGFNRDYNIFIYGRDYLEESSDTLFPVKHQDNRLPNKEQVLGIIHDEFAFQNADVTVYEIDEFGEGINLITNQGKEGEIVVAGSSDHHFAVAFKSTLDDGTTLNFEPVQNELPVIMKDQEGNYWDLFGYAVEGPRKGERLITTNSYIGYWFAWADFFPDLSIYQWDSQ